MLNDQAVYAKKVMNENPQIKNFQVLYFVQFIIGFAEGDRGKVVGLYKKIMDLNIKEDDKIKNITRQIAQMANTKIMSHYIYNNTNFPLLKKICEKYEDRSVMLDDLDVSKISYTTIINKKLTTPSRKLPLNLNIASISSIILAIITLIIVLIINGRFVNIEKEYYLLKNCKVFFIYLVIPFVNLMYSLYLKNLGLKYKRNLIFSIVSLGVLLLGGLTTIFSNTKYVRDEESVKYISDIIIDSQSQKFSPSLKNYDLIGEVDFDTCPSKIDGESFLIKTHVIRLNNDDIALFFREEPKNQTSLVSGYWTDSLRLQDYLPEKVINETKDFEKFAVCLVGDYCYIDRYSNVNRLYKRGIYNLKTIEEMENLGDSNNNIYNYYYDFYYIVVGAYDEEQEVFLIYEIVIDD